MSRPSATREAVLPAMQVAPPRPADEHPLRLCEARPGATSPCSDFEHQMRQFGRCTQSDPFLHAGCEQDASRFVHPADSVQPQLLVQDFHRDAGASGVRLTESGERRFIGRQIQTNRVHSVFAQRHSGASAVSQHHVVRPLAEPLQDESDDRLAIAFEQRWPSSFAASPLLLEARRPSSLGTFVRRRADDQTWPPITARRNEAQGGQHRRVVVGHHTVPTMRPAVAIQADHCKFVQAIEDLRSRRLRVVVERDATNASCVQHARQSLRCTSAGGTIKYVEAKSESLSPETQFANELIASSSIFVSGDERQGRRFPLRATTLPHLFHQRVHEGIWAIAQLVRHGKDPLLCVGRDQHAVS